MNKGWIGVDLDGTLAEYTTWKGPKHIGAPISKMVARVKKWLADGKEVRIFTARVAPGNPRNATDISRAEELQVIIDWCQQHIGTKLVVTCIKDFGMIELWDDRAVAVMPNTGEAVRYTTEGLINL